jgi:hypothetical protein
MTHPIILSFDVGIKNLAYCLFEYTDTLSFKILDWNILNIGTTEKTNVLHHQSEILFQLLYDNFHDININYVVVENQPVLKNPVMKSIQMMVYSYFKILKRTTPCIDKVVMINAGNKMRFANTILSLKIPNITETLDQFENQPKYKKTKNLSIHYTRELLRYKDYQTHLDFFQDFKKKDDLADTLLQGLYFCYTNIKYEI